MPVILPLTGQWLKAYNLVATTPPDNPLGDLINALYALHVSGVPAPASANDVTFTALCTEDEVVGDLVRVSGMFREVIKADITDASAYPAVGCIVEKSSSTIARVQTTGVIAGVFTNLIPGARYFAGMNGRIVTPAPVPVDGPVFVQPIGVALDPNTLIFNPSMYITKIGG